MEEQKTAIGLTEIVDGGSRGGRPRLRWFIYVAVDARSLGIHNWMAATIDRQLLEVAC